MSMNSRSIPYPVFALVVGPFVSKLAARQGFAMGARALLVGLGVLLLAGALSLILGPRTQRKWSLVLAAGVGATVGSLLADILG